MLRLTKPSRKGWVTDAMLVIDEILIDHAHCEKKAASSALNFIFRYPEYESMMQPLSELAREELRHFEEVMAVLKERNIQFRRLEPSQYAGRLTKIVRKDLSVRMLDMMLCASLIEARSCERMKLLSNGLEVGDPKLSFFYKELLVSEARHSQVYLELLGEFYSEDQIYTRLGELSEYESQVLFMPAEFTRLHSA